MPQLAAHIKSNVVAYLALFVALSGVAYAAERLPKNSVRTKQIANNAVTKKKIAPRAVDASRLAPGAVGRAALAPGAVDSGVLAPGSVDAGKIAPGAVDSDRIADGSVGAADLAPGLLPAGIGSDIEVYKSIAPAEISIPGPAFGATADGPQVTVDVPQDAIVMWYATAKIRGTASDQAVFVNEASLGGDIYLLGSFAATVTPQKMSSYLKINCGGLCQNNTGAFGEWQVTPLSPGTHTFRLRYQVSGSGNGQFSDRQLWVAVIS